MKKLKTKMIKRLIIIMLSTVIVTACEKEESESSLNIVYLKSEQIEQQKAVQDLAEGKSINIFPNPFLKETTMIVTGGSDKTITVTDDKGRFKVIPIKDPTFKLDFTNEKKGSYYCEIKIDNLVVPITLIKAE
jgi:hypothetical protein